MGLTLITPPSIVPVSLLTLRRQLNIADDDTTHDDRLSSMASDAAEYVERHTRRSMVTQTFDFTTSWRKLIEIPRPPLQSVVSVNVTGIDGSETTMAAEDYEVITVRFPGVVIMPDSMPSLREFEPVRIRFVAGYGAAETSVPAPMRELIARIVTFYFEPGRGDVGMAMPQHIKDAIRGMSSGMKSGFFKGTI
jgi:uncharacterized phiE125 gp8 family phage protein